MIYQIDYISDQLRVKGYLGFPPNTASNVVHAMLQHIQRTDDVYVMDTLACSMDHRPKTTEESKPTTLHVTCCLAPYDEEQPPVDMSPGHFLPKLPLILYCRGGIGRVGAVRLKWIEEFAAQGYVVFAPAYRGNEGSEGRDEFGGSDTNDVLTAIDWLSQLPWIDSGRIHLLGFSRGAINAAQAAVQSAHASRLILWSGVSDLARTYEERIDLRRMMKRVIGGNPAKVPEKYKLRSPLHFAEEIRCPVLLVHGTGDELVSVEHSYRMLHRLQELNYMVEGHFYKDLRHHFPPLQHAAAIDRMFNWLRGDSIMVKIRK